MIFSTHVIGGSIYFDVNHFFSPNLAWTWRGYVGACRYRLRILIAWKFRSGLNEICDCIIFKTDENKSYLRTRQVPRTSMSIYWKFWHFWKKQSLYRHVRVFLEHISGDRETLGWPCIDPPIGYPENKWTICSNNEVFFNETSTRMFSCRLTMDTHFTHLMGINELWINETINDTNDAVSAWVRGWWVS